MHSSNSVAMKRIQKEQRDMNEDPSAFYYAEPLETEPFEWHFTIRGPPDTDYQGGIYHGIITLPNSYPFKPPQIEFMTENGRFAIKERICLTFTDYHPETWQPAWTIKNILQALVSHLPVDEENHQQVIGAIKISAQERQHMARKSNEYVCDKCGPISVIAKEKILPLTDSSKQELQKHEKDQTNQIFNFASAKAVKQHDHEVMKKEAQDSIKDEIKHIQKEIEDLFKNQQDLEKSARKTLNLPQKQQQDKYDGETATSKLADRLNQQEQILKDLRKQQSQTPSKNNKTQQQNSHQSKVQSDINDEQKDKLKKIREKGLKMYKKRLLEQLENDCKKKLMVINILFMIALGVTAAMYYGDIFIEIRLYDFLM